MVDTKKTLIKSYGVLKNGIQSNDNDLMIVEELELKTESYLRKLKWTRM